MPFIIIHDYLTDLTKNWNEICRSLDFDKTTMLSGYPIKMCGVPVPILNPYDEKEKGPFKFQGVMGKLFEIIWTELNCSVTQDTISDFDFSSAVGTPDNMFEDLFRDKYDVHENIIYETGIWQNEVNLLSTSGICYISRKKNKSISVQVLQVFTLSVWIAIMVFFTLMVITFFYLQQQGLSDAAMDVLRAIIGSSTIKEPKNLLKRIIFGLLLCFFLIITTFLQSKLNAMLVTLTQYEPLETIEDIIRHNHSIYASNIYLQHYETGVRKHIMAINHFNDCFNKMQTDNKVSCINDCGEISFYAHESVKIHITEDFYKKKYLVYLFREDCPLIKRVTDVFYAIFETGITKHIQDIVGFKYKVSTLMFQEYKSISFNEIKFAFCLLPIGFFCGGLSFMIEIILNIIKKNLSKSA